MAKTIAILTSGGDSPGMNAAVRAATVDGLIVIGGNGSLAGLELLSNATEAGDWPVKLVGVPASIDNDIALTGLAIGVNTAMNEDVFLL